MTTPINEHNMLTLDFWRDTVTYEGKTVPTGTLGCETLNIPDEVIEKLSKLCPRVNLLLETMNQETPNAALLPDAGKAAEEILTLLRDVPPFHRLDMDFYLPGISKAFTPEGLQAYSSAKLSGSLSTKQLEAVRLGVSSQVAPLVLIFARVLLVSCDGAQAPVSFVHGSPAGLAR